MILHVTRDYPPCSVGGLSSALPPIIERAVAEGEPSTVVSFDAWRPTRGTAGLMPVWTVVNGVPVLRVGTHTNIEEAKQAAGARVPTHVQVHHEMLWEFGASIAARWGAGTSLAVHVWQPHNNAARGFDVPTLSLTAQLRAVREADVVCAPTPVTAAAIAAVARRSISVAPLALDASWFSAADVAAVARRVVFAGRFEATKGLDVLLDTLLDVAQRLDQPIELHVAGGLPHNAKLERRMVTRLNQTPGVVFHGWLAQDALRDLIDSAHVVACPSRVETFGLVAAQAIVRGAAVVARPVGVLAGASRTPGVYRFGDTRTLPDALIEALRAPRPGLRGRDALCRSLRPEAVLTAWQNVWRTARA